MEVRIEDFKEDNKNFLPVIGEHSLELFSRFEKILGQEGLETLKNETNSILSNCVNPYSDVPQSSTNLVVGYVQSGKTMSFTTLSALASDNNFKFIIYLAGTKDNLLTQTTARLQKDLIGNEYTDYNNSKYYTSYENPTIKSSSEIERKFQKSTKPTILITVLKHSKRIADLTSLLKSNEIQKILKTVGVLIIDDEADQASLNGYANKNSKAEDWEHDEYTSTYKNIIELRNILPIHSYIQYTATPQGPLLISIVDLLSPKHHTVLTPGKAYTGGKTFFKEEPGLIITIPDAETFNSKKNDLSEPPRSLLNAINLHILSVAIVVNYLKKEKFLSMMIHADRDQDASEKFNIWVENYLKACNQTLKLDKDDIAYKELINSFKNVYPEAIKEYKNHDEDYPTFEQIEQFIPDIILDTEPHLIISRIKDRKPINWSGSQSHILIGADMLNRGFTVEKLATTYMPRYTIGKTNADTIQQRCRFFGYKKNYLWSCRVFLPEDVQVLYREYVEHEEEMRKWLLENKSLENVEHILLLSSQMNATRKNILPKDVVQRELSGWKKFNPFSQNAIEENNIVVEKFISNYKDRFSLYKNYEGDDRKHNYLKLSIQETVEFLSIFKCPNIPDMRRKQATIRYLKDLESSKKISYVHFFQMAQGRTRGREFDVENQRISSTLFSGSSSSSQGEYPGDSQIKCEDSICIQLHNIQFKCEESKKWNGKTAYTLAIYYPDDFALTYIG